MLNSDKFSAGFNSGGTRCAAAREGVEHDVGWHAGAFDDWLDQFQWQLRRKSWDSLIGRAHKPRDAPYIVPEFAGWIGSIVVVFGLAVGWSGKCVAIEYEPVGVLDAIEDVARTPIEVVFAIESKGLVPLDPRATLQASFAKYDAEIVRIFVVDHDPQAAVRR